MWQRDDKTTSGTVGEGGVAHVYRKNGKRPSQGAMRAYPSLSPVVLWLFLGFVLFRYLQGGHRIPALGSIRFEAIVGSILLIATLIVHLREKWKWTSKASSRPRLMGWVVALFLVMVLKVIFSVDPSHSWEVFVNRFVKFSLFGFMIFTFVSSPGILRMFLGAYLLAFMKMTQEGITGYITGSMVWENQGIPRLHGSTPSYAHPNSLGGTQLSLLPIVVAVWSASPKWVKMVLLLMGAGALLVSVFSGSRTAYLALGVWLVYVVYNARSKFRAVILLLVVAAFTVPFIPADYYARLTTVITQEEIEGASMDLRKEIFRDAFEVFLRHPMGVGVGAFPIVREQYFGRVQDTHNLYLEVATNLGFLGFLVFVGMMVSIFRALNHVKNRADRCVKRLGVLRESLGAGDLAALERQMSDVILIRQASIAATGFLIVRLSLGMFGHDLYEIYWWFVLGLAAALLRMQAVVELRVKTLSSTVQDKGDPIRDGSLTAEMERSRYGDSHR